MENFKLKTIDQQFYEILGEQIHKARKDKKISLRELQKITGLSRMTLDNFELGSGRIKDKHYENVCKALGITTNIKLDVIINN